MSKQLFCTAALLLLVAGAAQAQTPGVGIEFEPYIGAYVPFSDLGVSDISGSQLVAKQTEGFALGGRLLFKLGGAMGIEGNFLYALSDVEQEDATGTTTTDAYTWAADARIHLTLLPLGVASIHGTGGVAMVGHGGDAWEKVTEGDTDVAGVVGAGLTFGLGPIHVRGDADAYIYQAQITIPNPIAGSPNLELGSEIQTDLVLSAGIVLSY